MSYRGAQQANSVLAATKMTAEKTTLTASTASAVTPPAAVTNPKSVRVDARDADVHVEVANGEAASAATADSTRVGVLSPEWLPVGPSPQLSLFSTSDGDVVLTWLE